MNIENLVEDINESYKNFISDVRNFCRQNPDATFLNNFFEGYLKNSYFDINTNENPADIYKNIKVSKKNFNGNCNVVNELVEASVEKNYNNLNYELYSNIILSENDVKDKFDEALTVISNLIGPKTEI